MKPSWKPLALENVVVGVDGSRTSWRALSVAIDMAAHYQAKLHACHVWALTQTEERAGVSAAPLAAGEVGPGAAALVTEVTKRMEDAGVAGEFIEREGVIAHELEALASSSNADLIVVGRSTHPALHVGGVPFRLLANGNRLLLVVP